jgi:hypothetical protein
MSGETISLIIIFAILLGIIIWGITSGRFKKNYRRLGLIGTILSIVGLLLICTNQDLL